MILVFYWSENIQYIFCLFQTSFLKLYQWHVDVSRSFYSLWLHVNSHCRVDVTLYTNANDLAIKMWGCMWNSLYGLPYFFIYIRRRKKINLFLAKPLLQFPALICIIPSSDPETGGEKRASLFQAGETSPFSCLFFPGHIPRSFTAFTDESKFSDAAETPLPGPSCATRSSPRTRGMTFPGWRGAGSYGEDPGPCPG